MNKRQTGSFYEDKAAEYLHRKGLEIIRKNYRCRIGEIDLIARDGDCLVFAEVKYRSSLKNGYPAEAVSPAKQRRIYRAAQWYLMEHNIHSQQKCRFDAVSIYQGEITWIPNAFGGF